MFIYIYLLSVVLYNYDNPYIRLSVVLFIIAYPVIVASRAVNFVILSNDVLRISGFYLLWILTIFISFLFNADSFAISIYGPNVEMLTPFMFISIVFALILFDRRNQLSLPPGVNEIKKSLNLIVAVLIFDLIIRYYLEPYCFMNYSCRFEAKTVGLYVTTNATALSVMFVLLVLRVIGGFKAYEIILIALLISTMGRSAIVAYFVVVPFVIYSKSGFFGRFLINICFFGFLLYFYFHDPFSFRSDGSALSKLDFFKSVGALIVSSSIANILFGFGASFDSVVSALGVNDWSPHVPILKSIMYFGLIGAAFYIFSLNLIIRQTRILLLPIIGYLVAGGAGAPIVFPAIIWGLWVSSCFARSHVNSSFDSRGQLPC
jgi:hypothetical protein